jgi:hypothetical protein
MMRDPQPCDVPASHAPGPIRPYVCGWRCPAHTPAAQAGRPEPPPGPGPLPGAWATPTPQGVAHVLDERAIASGKRRSNPAAYKAAVAATRKDHS